MTLTKREKLLLQIMVCLAVFSLILVFLVLPQMEEKVSLNAQKDELTAELDKKEVLLADQTLQTRYDEAFTKAQENYDYFYDVLNTYTIDEILNSLIQEYGISVASLNISDYEDANADFEELDDSELKVLVKSTVNLTVTGDYQQILKFVGAMNDKSPCLNVDTISIVPNTDSVNENDMTAAFRIYIYGINVKTEGLNIAQ